MDFNGQRNGSFNGPGPLPNRWLKCPRKASDLLANKFLAFKTPLDNKFDDAIPLACRFTPSMLLGSLKSRNWKLCAWIDLTKTERYYDKQQIEEAGCTYVKLPCQGHEGAPTIEQTDTFIALCNRFISYHPLDMIAVHCTHGFNRTGFLLVAFMVENMDCSVEAALHEFAKIRPPGIYKAEYILELYRRYDDEADAPSAPPMPGWCFEDNTTGGNGDDDDDGYAINSASGSGGGSSRSSGGRKQLKDQQPSFSRNNNNNNNNNRKSWSPRGGKRKSNGGAAVGTDIVFMEGVPGVETVTNFKIIDKVHRRIMELCDVKHNSFPGSQPVSMDKANIQLIASKPYRVSWKADGTRYMLFIGGHEEVYFIDRNNNVFLTRKIQFFHRKAGHHLCDTLLDGEMVIDKNGNEDIPRYLIYDIVIFEGNRIGELEFYPKRLTAIDVEIIRPRIDAMKEGRIIKEVEPFSVRAKSFFDISQSEYLLSDRFSSKLAHEPDGLVFQPSIDAYKFGKTPNVLKWKPLSMNSVDFLLQVVPETRAGYASQFVGNLMVQNRKELVKFGEIKCTRAVKALNGRIIECSFENNQWVLMRERTDKSFPNGYETAKAVFNSIRDPITKDNLLRYINHYAWKDPMPPPMFVPPIKKSKVGNHF